MSTSAPEPDETDEAPGAASGGPTDEQLPGNRGDGPDEHPLDAEESEGGQGGVG